jgi:hypothetical protein
MTMQNVTSGRLMTDAFRDMGLSPTRCSPTTSTYSNFVTCASRRASECRWVAALFHEQGKC